MDFTLSDEQELLVESAARWAGAVRASGVHRDVVSGKPAAIEDLWSEPARNGWLGIVTPVEHGGSGGTLVDACLVLSAMYRELVPLPFATNAVIIPQAVMTTGGALDLLAPLASGDRHFALGLSADLTHPGTELAWEWSPNAEVAVISAEGVLAAPASAVVGPAGRDLLWPLAGLNSDAGVLVAANGWGRFAMALDVAASAVLVGLMEGAATMAMDHARNREQFGQPIGAFQAVQHLCAQMHVDVEASRAACLGAASAIDAGSPDARRVAAVAKAWCAEASIQVVETAIQVLGGIGNTWESDAHLYLRACHQWRLLGGDTSRALDTVAADLFGDGGDQ